MTRYRVELCFAALWIVFATTASASAQSSDPILDQETPEPTRALSWFSDLLLRGDAFRDVPGNVPDDERYAVRVRAGLRWAASESWEAGLALEGSRASASTRALRVAHDNQRGNDFGVDQLYGRWRAGEATSLTLGKSALPLELSPMVWDNELRPVGVSFEHAVPIGDFDRFVLAGGAWRGDHLYDDTSRIMALQAGWRFREGAPTGGSILLALLDFSSLDSIVRSGLARSNRRAGGQLISDYRLLDLQLSLNTRLGDRPLRAQLDLVRNIAADNQRNGARGSLILGNSRSAREWELGFAYQRIQRDAVMTAFNSEDWWFHSAMRGAMPWIGYGINDNWRVQFALFLERNDGRAEDLERALFDLRAQW